MASFRRGGILPLFLAAGVRLYVARGASLGSVSAVLTASAVGSHRYGKIAGNLCKPRNFMQSKSRLA